MLKQESVRTEGNCFFKTTALHPVLYQTKHLKTLNIESFAMKKIYKRFHKLSKHIANVEIQLRYQAVCQSILFHRFFKKIYPDKKSKPNNQKDLLKKRTGPTSPVDTSFWFLT